MTQEGAEGEFRPGILADKHQKEFAPRFEDAGGF